VQVTRRSQNVHTLTGLKVAYNYFIVDIFYEIRFTGKKVVRAVCFVVNDLPLMFQLDFIRQGSFKTLRKSVVL
jgi:hypothetical protein